MFNAIVNNIPNQVSAGDLAHFLDHTLLAIQTESITLIQGEKNVLTETGNFAILNVRDYQYRILSNALGNVVVRDGDEDFRL